MDEEKRFREVLAALYQAGLDDALWPDGLRKLLQYCGNLAKIALVITDSASGGTRTLCASTDDDSDNWVSRCFGSGGDACKFMRVDLNVRACCSCALLGLYRGLDRGDNQTDPECLEWLLPHLEQAVCIGIRIGGLVQQSIAAQLIADTVAYGVLLLGADGQIIQANRTARVFLAACDGLTLHCGRLRSDSQKVDDALQSEIAAVTENAEKAPVEAADWLPVPRLSGRAAYHLVLSRLSACSAWGSVNGAVAVVLVADPEHRPFLEPGALSRLFGLTQKEAALAAQLGTGRSIDECARRLSMNRNTARAHQQQIYRKTGTCRQADLVRVLLNLPMLNA